MFIRHESSLGSTHHPNRSTTSNDGFAAHRRLQCKEDLYAVASSWFDNSNIPAVWKENLSTFQSLRVSVEDLQQRPGLRLGSHAQNIANRMRRLSDILWSMVSVLDEEYDAFALVNRNHGLALLPDEIVNIIFELVVNDYKSQGTDYYFRLKWKSAMRISHVCQRFRNIMLAYPGHWMNMSPSAGLRAVAAFLPRTKDLPLWVDFLVHPTEDMNDWTIDSFVAGMLPYTHRWGHLGMLLHNLNSNVLNAPISQNLEQLNAPLLEELFIESYLPNRGHRLIWNWSLWNTPKLQRIQTIHHFPSSLPGLTNVTSLDLTFRLNEPMYGILKEISQMHQLREFTLELDNGFFDNDEGLIYPYRNLEFQQIERLTIKTELHSDNLTCTPALKCSRFSYMFFPSAAHLNLKLNGFRNLEYAEDDSVTRNYYFHKEIIRIFRHVDQFPKVKSFNLHIHSPYGDHHNSVVVTKLSIPFNMLPSVKHFTLESNTRFDIEDPEEPDEIVFEQERRIAPRVVGSTLPVLETIILDMLDASVTAGWLKEYLEKLRERGELSGFRELVILRDEKLGSDCHKRLSYAADEALDWCSRSVCSSY